MTLATGLLLQYLASSVRWIESRITVQPIRWIGLGLLLAAGLCVLSDVLHRRLEAPLLRWATRP